MFKALHVLFVNCLQAGEDESGQLLTVPDSLDRRQSFPLTSFLPVCTFDVSISFKVNCKSEFPDFLIFAIYLVYHYRLLKLLQLPKCAFRLHFV